MFLLFIKKNLLKLILVELLPNEVTLELFQVELVVLRLGVVVGDLVVRRDQVGAVVRQEVGPPLGVERAGFTAGCERSVPEKRC